MTDDYTGLFLSTLLPDFDAALATDAGRGWLSPEEAERLRKDLKDYKDANEQLSAALTSADNRYHLLLDATEKGGLVSEEECERRCREVAIQFLGAATGSEARLFTSELADLSAIIERVAKGGG